MNIIKLKTYEERKDYLEKKIDELHYADLMDRNFDKLVEHTKGLYELESYTNYLLKAYSPAYEEKEKEYPMYKLTSKQMKEELAKKESQFNQDDKGRDVIPNDGELKSNAIKYKSKDIVITSKLLNEQSELGEVLKSYEPVRKHLSQELQKYKEGKGADSYYEYGFIRRQLKTIKQDMILSIKSYKGLNYESPAPTKAANMDIDNIDYSDWKVIKRLLREVDIYGQDSKREFDTIIIAVDLYEALGALELNDEDTKIVKQYNNRVKLKDIATEVGLHHSNVIRRIDKACKIVAKQLA